jgi:hypothetical protein
VRLDSSNSTAPRVYADNCIVGALVRHDHPEQISAISALLNAHEQGTIHLVASTEVLGEIQQLPATYQGPHIALYERLRKLPASNVTWLEETSTGSSVRTDPMYSQLEQVLSGANDRRHMFHAVKQCVEYFATVDQRTILSRAKQLETLFPIRLGKPTDVVAMLGLGSTSSAT